MEAGPYLSSRAKAALHKTIYLLISTITSTKSETNQA